MAKKETIVAKIVKRVAGEFPIIRTLGDRPPAFLYGVLVEEVVRFVLAKRRSLSRTKRRALAIGDDARDHLNSMQFLEDLSDSELKLAAKLAYRDIQDKVKVLALPFQHLTTGNWVALENLPPSWIRGAARLLLESRERKASRTKKKEKK